MRTLKYFAPFILLAGLSGVAHATDTDGDGVDDAVDAFPLNYEADTDTDADGQPDVLKPRVSNNFATASTLAWTTGKNASTPQAWSLKSSSGRTDGAYVSSNTVAVNGVNWMQMDYIAGQPGVIKFWYRCFGTGVKTFYLDGASMLSCSFTGSTWTSHAVSLTAGPHTLNWETTGGASGSGRFEIDDVEIFENSTLTEDNDDDNDGVVDSSDLFPLDPAKAGDTDGDGVDALVDNCPGSANANQLNTDADAQGDVCDADDDNDGAADASDKFPLNAAASVDPDNDGFPSSWNAACDLPCQNNSGLALDNCPAASNATQLDTDGDAQGNACDTDDDNDGVADASDHFPLDATESADADGDGVGNNTDNCASNANADQADTDSDGVGDICDGDADPDGDGVANATDNCPSVSNANQLNADGDAQGDVCDTTPNGDTDNDGVDNTTDNCVSEANADQSDYDGDGAGNVCDATPSGPGALDFSFNFGGVVSTAFGNSYDLGSYVIQQADGKLVVAGSSRTCLACNDSFAIVRYKADGSLDSAFGINGKVTTAFVGNAMGLSVIQQADGKLVIAGVMYSNGKTDFALARYNSNGALDSTFGVGGKLTTPVGPGSSNARQVIQQSDGKLVVTGWANNGTNDDFALVRYNSDGSLDTSFDADGMLMTAIGAGQDVPRSVLQQQDGKLVVVGFSFNVTNNDVAVVRYNSDGSLDAGFDGDGVVLTDGGGVDDANAMIQQANGKLVVAASGARLIRYNSDGSLDATFAGDGIASTTIFGNDSFNALVQQADGKLVAAGSAREPVSGALSNLAVVRFNSDGSLDTTFSGDGKAVGANSCYARSIIQQKDGKLVVSGECFGDGDGDYDFITARYISGQVDSDGDGTVDGLLDADGDSITDDIDNCPVSVNTDQLNTDGDSEGDTCDSDDDNDSVDDASDAFPLDETESVDTDGDGIGNNADATPNGDTDSDGVDNNSDNCVSVSNTDQLNADGDAEGDVCDNDDDNDGIADVSDAFPFDATESVDTDNDGVGDSIDAFPAKAEATIDTDGDGMPDSINTAKLVLVDGFSLTPPFSIYDNGTFGDWKVVSPGTVRGSVLSIMGTFPNGKTLNLVVNVPPAGAHFYFTAFRTSGMVYTHFQGGGVTKDYYPSTSYTEQGSLSPGSHSFSWYAHCAGACVADGHILGGSVIANSTLTEDDDDDNDGVLDVNDADPLDPNFPVVDSDSDGINNNADNCVSVSNADQLNTDGDAQGDVCDAFPLDATESVDTDSDGIGNSIDNCVSVSNADQLNTDGDAQGNVCDTDDDNDGVADVSDVFPLDATESADTDGDGIGNNADITPNGDTDNDGVDNLADNCVSVSNADQLNTDHDAQGNVCDTDDDNDGVPDVSDAFSLDATETADIDNDGIGNNADSDDDNDTVPDVSDNCPSKANSNQMNADGDALGNACDSDDDNDGAPDSNDNCPTISNASQTDTDNDGVGDACDSTINGDTDGDGVDNNSDNCPTVSNADQIDIDADGAGDVCDLFPLDGELLLEQNGAAKNENFASSIAMADMNDDGVVDVLVGAPMANVSADGKILKKAGVIRIISGADNSTLRTLNGSEANQKFGTAIAVVDDQNSDDVPDVVVGEPLADITTTVLSKTRKLKDAGRVALYSGSDGALINVIAEGSKADDNFGAAVAVGDVDNDAEIDLIVGAPMSDAVAKNAGQVTVFDGLSNTVLYARYGYQPGEHFGAAVAVGAGVLFIGSPQFDVDQGDGTSLKDAGHVSGYFGYDEAVSGEVFAYYGGEKGDALGAAVAAAPNGDHVIGMPLTDYAGKDSGSVMLYRMVSPNVMEGTVLSGATASDNFGGALAIKDVDNDGVLDFAIGAAKFDVSTSVEKRKSAGVKTVLLKDAGRVEVLNGAAL